MPRAVVHIGPDGIDALAAKPHGDRLVPVLERRVRLRPPLVDGGAVFAVATAELARCRQAGAGQSEILIASALHGTHLLRALSRRFETEGLPKPRVLSPSEEIDMAFRGAAQAAGATAATMVVSIADCLTAAVGEVDGGVGWWATRVVSPRSLTSGAARSDPPDTAQSRAITAGVGRSLSTLRPPPSSETVLAGAHAQALRPLFDTTIIEGPGLKRVREQVAFAHSEILAGQLGVGPAIARELPAAIELIAGIGARFGLPMRISHGGLLEGALVAADGKRRFISDQDSLPAGAVG